MNYELAWLRKWNVNAVPECYQRFALSLEVNDEVVHIDSTIAKICTVEKYNYRGAVALLLDFQGENGPFWLSFDSVDWLATVALHQSKSNTKPKKNMDNLVHQQPKTKIKPIFLGSVEKWVNVYMDNRGQLVTPKGRLHSSKEEAEKYGKTGVDSKGWIYVSSVCLTINGK